MRIFTKRTLQVALVSGGLLMVGAGSASALGGVADTVENTTGDLQVVRPLEQAVTGAGPARTLGAVLHTVPADLFRYEPAPSAEVTGDLPEHDLNAPLGRELRATDLPVLPLTATPDAEPDQAAVLPVLPALPVHGSVSTQPLDPEAAPAGEERAAGPAAGLPLLGGLLPSTGGLLPSLTGVTDLTQPAGGSPLTQLLHK